MPRGIALIGWTNKEGFFLISKYPETFNLTSQEIMRIGSLHRMRRLDANVITLKLKELNVVSFFSGLITAQYYIAPNFVLSLLLEKDEAPKTYIKTLPLGAKIVLSEFPVKRFDARTTTFQDVLSNIGKSYVENLPRLFDALVSDQIPINEDELAIILAAEQKSATIEIEYAKLKEELENKTSMITTLQSMIEEHSKAVKDKSEETLDRFKETLENKMQIEELKAEIVALKKKLVEINNLYKSECNMNELHQETITLLLDHKLVMQHRDIETREFLQSLKDALKSFTDDFHLEIVERIQDYLKQIEWVPEMD